MLFLLIGAIILTACAPAAMPNPAATPAPKKSGTIRVGFPTSTDMGDVPSLMAHELLTAQGYTIQAVAFASADLEAAALAQGQIDIANGSMRTVWLAIAKGANARTIMEQLANVWSLVAKPEYKTCADLNGKRIAFTSNSSLNRALFDAYAQSSCPSLKFEPLLISGSESRAAALLSGELDATPLELADWIHVQRKAPDRFHAIANFAQEMPNLKTTGVYAHAAIAEQQPDAVRDYLHTLIGIHRAIRSKPADLQNAAVKYLKLDSATAQTVVQAYLSRNIWDVNGGLTRADVQYSIDLFGKSKSIPEGLTVDGVADLSYLSAVLDEMGRQ